MPEPTCSAAPPPGAQAAGPADRGEPGSRPGVPGQRQAWPDPGSGLPADGLREVCTLAALLAEPTLRGARVLAGQDRLGTEIGWVLPWAEAHATDGPLDAIAAHARAAELRADSPAGLAETRAALDGLARRGLAALLVHGPAGPAEPLLAGCELPVVQLPGSASFLVCNQIVAWWAIAAETRALRYGIAVHRTLGELLHLGAGLAALGRQLARLAGCPALVLDAAGEVLSYEYVGAETVPDPSEVVRLLLRWFAERPGPGAPGGTGPPPPAAGHPEITLAELPLVDAPVTCVVAPIVLGNRGHGWVVLVELAHPAPEADLRRHHLLAEQAVTIIGSELLRVRSVEAAEERARGDFVHAILHGRFTDPHDLAVRAAHHDFDTAAAYGVVVARPRPAPPGRDAVETVARLARRVEHVAPRPGQRTLGTVIGDVVVAVRQLPGGRGGGRDPLAAYAEALAADLREASAGEVRVAYGRPVTGARAVAGSYREALIALELCERLGIETVSGYRELRVFAALSELAASRQGQAFARDVLAPLRTPAEAGGDLEAVVVAFVESGGNLNEAARRLSVHRNTMSYKLGRASRLLGLDLREAESRFTFWLAHRTDLMGEITSSVDRRLRPPS